MAYRLKSISAAGGCCTCANQADACTCNDRINVDISCRSRGGTATLCGFSEYVDPSTPPKKYLTRTLAGTLTYGDCDDPFASPSGSNQWSMSFAYSGSTGYTAGDSCTITQHGTLTKTRSDDCAACGACTAGSSVSAVDDVVGYCGSQGDVYTPTSHTIDHDGGTVQIGTFGSSLPYFSHEASGGIVSSTLSDEDTEFDSIERLRSANDWPGYTVCRDSTHASTYCCKTAWQARTTGFSFAYTEAGWEFIKTDLDPAVSYELTYEVWRKPYGSADTEYVLFETLSQAVQVDSFGALEVEGDTPIERGYESAIGAAYLTPSS